MTEEEKRESERAYYRQYYKDNKEKKLEKAKANYQINKENIKKQKKEYCDKNRENINKKRKAYVEKNRDKVNEKQKIYHNKNKEKYKEKSKERAKAYYKKNKKKIIEQQNEYLRNRRAQDVLFRVSHNLGCSLVKGLSRGGFSKNSRTEVILGCSFVQFKLHIESRWEPWMNWGNYGKYNGELNHGWDLDHIIPTSTATTQEEVERLYHWTNYQPLCSRTNRDIKKARTEWR